MTPAELKALMEQEWCKRGVNNAVFRARWKTGRKYGTVLVPVDLSREMAHATWRGALVPNNLTRQVSYIEATRPVERQETV